MKLILGQQLSAETVLSSICHLEKLNLGEVKAQSHPV